MRINVALIGAMLAVALTGCACSPDNPPDPPPSSAVTTGGTVTPSATPPPPTLPAAARADSPTGAEAFARYWLITLDYAYQTGNTTPLQALGACKTCVALTGGIDRLYSEGGQFEGGKIAIKTAEAIEHKPDQRAVVKVRYSRPTRRAIRNDGRVEESPGSDRLGFLLTLNHVAEGWNVTLAQTFEES